MLARDLEAPSYSFSIDRDDLICEVSEDWVEFARCYHPRGGQLADVVGTSIWDYITEPRTRTAYHRMIEKARRSGEPQVSMFRCDAPDYRRWMLMVFHTTPDGGIRFESNIGREDRRKRVRLIDPCVPRDTERTLNLCTWCYHVETPSGDWLEVEDALAAHDVDLQAERQPVVKYDICAYCADRMEKLIS